MDKENALRILTQIKESDIVLDIGGWFRPFNRANFVLDFMPYETRSKGGQEGITKEYFSKQTWIQRDISDKKPFPFKDKEIDFVICSHTLEDVRDPVFICSEICRIGQRGYVEVPSKIAELCIGIENKHYAGCGHHRWLIDTGDKRITFVFKPHFIHKYWKYHFPSRYGQRLKQEDMVQWFFWEGQFDFEERLLIDIDQLPSEVENFIRSKQAYPQWRYQLERLKGRLRPRRV